MIKNYLCVLAVLVFGLTGFAQQIDISIETPAPVCSPGSCTELKANYIDLKETSTYTVSNIPFQNIYPFTGGDQIANNADDVWSESPINLSFGFCFYGTSYGSILIGSNGVITFDILNNYPGSTCPYEFNTTIPNIDFPIKNAIYGVYQDTDIRPIANGGHVTNAAIQNVNYYVSGTSPNKKFIINYNELPLYDDNNESGLQTSQIVLHETTNIIDIFIKNRTSITTNSVNGNGVVGLQNQEGTQAVIPNGRNTGIWTAVEEGWRFQPAGNTAPHTFTWIKNGQFYSNENPITVCPSQSESYTAIVNYVLCNGLGATGSASANIILQAPLPVANPLDIAICTATAPSFDLTANTAVMLNGLDPNYFEVGYFTAYDDAINYANNINSPQNYAGSNGEVIYARITDATSSSPCPTIKSFTLTVNTPLIEPSGDPEQSFTTGETLADIELSGNAVDWYAASEGGEPLPVTTILVDGATYYAELSGTDGCTSLGRSALAERFAVTVSVALGTQDWTNFKFKAVPNPVKDILNISSAANITSVAIYNLLGQEVIHQSVDATETRISMAGLPDGTYLMKVSANHFIKTMKVIKQ